MTSVSSNLSSVESIRKNADFNPDGFSAVKALGSFINSRDFSRSFVDFCQNRPSAGAYVWTCLSACADEIGETVYSNVKNYVDFVSNVETCKIQSLRSMMKMYGFDYTVFDDIELVPAEVLNLMHVMSIDKKYLLSFGYLKDGLRADLKACGAINNTSIGELSDYYMLSALTDEQRKSIVSSCETIDENKYFDYTCGLFETLLSGFCSLKYLQRDENDDENKYYIYKTLDTGVFSEEIDQYNVDFSEFKRQHNIPVTFSQSKVVDEIDAGNDSLDNYQYPYYDLLMLEIDRRAAKVSKAELNEAAGDVGKYVTTDESIRNETRYSYYRKAKVREYVNFIDNKYFMETTFDGLSAKLYDVDQRYVCLGDISASVLNRDEAKRIIGLNSGVIRKVARSLTVATTYVNKLREKLKLQTRKNYMKGTQNLLLYIINEYLIDYSRHQAEVLDLSAYESKDRADISAVLSALQQHSIDQLNVIEYYDDTEYYNLSTSTTQNAVNADSVNRRFWHDTDMTVSDGKTYALAEIQKFYLSTLAMQDVITEDSLSDFLDTVFDIGSDRSYIDKTTGMFTVKLSAYDRYSDSVYSEYSMLSDAYSSYLPYKPDGYEYVDGPISDQVSAAVDAISADLREKYSVGISTVYDTYAVSVDAFDSRFAEMNQTFDNIVSGDNMLYFISSDCKYCFSEDQTTGEKRYRHNYYIGNPKYQQDENYFTTKLNTLWQYIDEQDEEGNSNITNFPVIDTVSAVYDKCDRLCAEYENNIVAVLTGYGFTDFNRPTLDAEFQDGYDFAKDRMDRRLTFLREQLNQVRSDASQLKTLYQNIQTNFAAVVAGYDDGSEDIDIGATVVYAVSRSGMDWTLPYKASKPDNKIIDRTGLAGFCQVSNSAHIPDIEWIQYNVSLTQYAFRCNSDYQQIETGGKYYPTGTNGYRVTNLPGYKSTDTLESRINAFIRFLEAPTAFEYTQRVEGEGANAVTIYEILPSQISYGLKKEGTYTAATQCNDNLTTIKNTITSVVNQINAIGGEIDPGQLQLLDIGKQIDAIVEYITTQFSEANFENDLTVQAYKQIIAQITQLSSQYIPYKEDYLALYSSADQGAYLSEFQHSNDLTFDILNKLIVYAKNRDRSNKESIIQQHEGLQQSLNDLQQDYESLAGVLQHLEYEYYKPDLVYEPYYDQYSGIIEIGLTDVRTFLNTDLAKKQDDVDWKVGFELDKVDGYVGVMTSEISAELGSTDKFEDVVKNKLEKLDIFKDDQYLQRKDLFLTYAGQEMCYYPYFNMTNVAHPSYQVHPFLWNFISKQDADVSELTKVFYTINPAELNGTEFTRNVDMYYGKFGQAVNKWLNRDLLDYSGYITRYESSDHIGNTSQISSEVVDFDGAFYPPAVDELFRAMNLNGSIDRCVNSILCGVYFSNSDTRGTMLKALEANPVSSYIEVRENYDEEKSVISSWTYVRDISVYQLLSGFVEPYLVSVDLKNDINTYFRKNLTEAHISAVSDTALVDNLISGFEPTFYDRFYKHLNYAQNTEELTYLAEQLSLYFPQLKDTLFSSQTRSEQYDIYRYGIDQLGNMYSLFKQYHSEDPLYYDRKNTTGSLWIRFKDHPFSFPAFTGLRPNVMVSSYADIPLPFIHLAGLDGMLSSAYPHYISSAMSCFYDFEMTKNGQYMYLVSDRKGTGISEDARLKLYENPWLINCPMTYAQGGVTIMDFKHKSVSADETTSIIRSGADDDCESALSVMPEEGNPIRSYAYLGPYLKNNSTTNFVYAEKTYSVSGDVLVSLPTGSVKILQTVNGCHRDENDITGSGLFPSPACSDVCFSYDRDGTITFAYIKEKILQDVQTVLQSHTNLDKNTDGMIFSDPRSAEMNSHDIFTSDVAVVKCTAQTNALRPATKRQAADSVFNMNADMSYLPCYPGVSGEISVYATGLSPTQQLPFQLLGDSKNIDENIKIVNEDVDPYFDVSRISSDYLFGRVYEDWQEYENKDNTFRLFSNDTLNDRSDPEYKDVSCFVWSIPLSSYEYNRKAKTTLRVIIYNTDTLGKNPYLVGMVRGLSTETSEWLDIGNYNDEFTVENSREKTVETTMTGADVRVNVTGTFDGKHYQNQSDCNHLDNIKNLQIRYMPVSEELQLRFLIADMKKAAQTYVRKNQIKVLLYNPNDLTMFKYFHYLDTYGAVNVYDGRLDIPSDIPFANGSVKFVYDKKKYEELNMTAVIRSYFEDEAGVKRFLTGPTAIQLSDYTCLSDVYILRGTRGLQMKYSDEDIFDFNNDHYYYPALNVKYPKTAGDFVSSPSCLFENQARENLLSGIFGENNLYILDLADPSRIVSQLGRVEIPVAYDDADCFRCFESETVFEDGSCVSNMYHNYDVEDSRTMQYVRFDEFSKDKSTKSDISRAFEYNYETSAFVNAISSVTLPRFSEAVENHQIESVKFDVKSADFSDLMKLYVNYKKSDDGITLYFNYFNYLNTPYVRIEQNKVYPDYVDGTYLKLGPGENGVVNVVAQFKYYVGNTVYGCRNAKIVSYKVYNVSDDKPKFLINEIDRIKPGDLLDTQESPNVTLVIAEKTINLSEYGDADHPTSYIECAVDTDRKLSAPFVVEIDYPYDLVYADTEDVSYGIRVEEDSHGFLTVMVLDAAVDYFRIRVVSRHTAKELADYINRYRVDIEGVSIIGANGYEAVTQVENGSFNVIKRTN